MDRQFPEKVYSVNVHFTNSGMLPLCSFMTSLKRRCKCSVISTFHRDAVAAYILHLMYHMALTTYHLPGVIRHVVFLIYYVPHRIYHMSYTTSEKVGNIMIRFGLK